MSQEPAHDAGDRRRLHNVRNHLAVIVGFCDLLLGDIPAHDPRHADVIEMRKAAHAAMALLDGLRET
jgi:hypothetical protein